MADWGDITVAAFRFGPIGYLYLATGDGSGDRR